MKLGNQYIIPFKGLKEGDHEFDFEIGEAFFEEYSLTGIRTGLVHAVVLLSRRNSFLELEVSLNGTLSIQCDRCLEYFDFPLYFSGPLFVKFKEEPEEADDQIMYMHPDEDLLDLTQYFIDSIGLSLPIQNFHPEDEEGNSGCDPEMIARLNEHSTYELNQGEEIIDPRWEKLKNLLRDDNKN